MVYQRETVVHQCVGGIRRWGVGTWVFAVGSQVREDHAVFSGQLFGVTVFQPLFGAAQVAV